MTHPDSLANTGSPRGRVAHAFFLDAQDKITEALAQVDGKGTFVNDEWTRDEGGGGRTRILSNGRVIEKGGVNVSCVHGELSESFAAELPGEGRRFFATGLSLVIHPSSPHVPTVHANLRYLEKGNASTANAWFGGGSDLTPYVLYEEDAVHFHRVWRDLCARHAFADYIAMKRWCDEYFYIQHRNETRGVGGIFFDYLGSAAGGAPARNAPLQPASLDEVFGFVQDAAGSFLEAYLPIVERRKHQTATEEERTWQLRRRGRYVEFNLVYDRGTIFGLKTKGRIESILMSLPSLVRWDYDDAPIPETYQSRLVDVLRAPRDWLGAESK